MSEQVSYLDYILGLRNWNHYTIARAELAALRARVAELELSAANGTEIMWQNAKLTKRVAELESTVSGLESDNGDLSDKLAQSEALRLEAEQAAQAALTPRQCVTCNPLAPSKPVDEVEMCKCGNYAATPPHVCPYAEDINGDSETLCTCCDVCTAECASDI